jgi:hypothetical protein
MRKFRFSPLLISLFLIAGCGWSEGPLMWPGLEPVEDVNRAELPGTEDDPHPETIGVARGEEPDYEWVHARGWVRAPIEVVWAAIQDPEVLVDRRRVDEWWVEHDVDPDIPVSFLMTNVVHDVITLGFDQLWRQAHVEGSRESPKSVWARSDLVSSNLLMTTLRTSIVLKSTSSQVTEVQLIRQIKVVAAGGDDAEQYLRDLYQSILARVRGRSLPSWE